MNPEPIRHVSGWPLLLAAALLAGCDTISIPNLSEARFHDAREVWQDKAVTHQACREALEAMGFVYEKGRASSGELEMATRLNPGSAAQLVRQRRVIVAVVNGINFPTRIKVGFWEVSEDASPANAVSASGRLVREPSLYDAFWRRLDATLPPIPEPESPPGSPNAPPSQSPAGKPAGGG